MYDLTDRTIHSQHGNPNSASESRLWLSLALFAALAAAIPLLITPGLINTRGGGDSPFLLVRTYEMAQGLRSGQFPVRWMADAAYGLGYPFFNYYAALPYYLAAALHLLGLGILTAIEMTQLVGFFAAAAGSYALARRWLGSPPAAALVSVAYTLAPFHLVNVYVRGDSLSEFYAFVWYPLILLALQRLFEYPSAGRACVMALTLAALIVTHNISALIFAPFAALYTLLLFGSRAVQGKRLGLVGGCLLAAALAVLLSAWLWLPALGELEAVQLGEAQTGGYFHYSSHFRSCDLVQPTVWFDYDPDAAPTPFAMGLIQAALTLLGAAALAWRWLKRRRIDPLGLFALLTLLIATLLITPLSRPLWDHLPLLPLVQFPWRFLSVQALAASLLIGTLATAVPRSQRMVWLTGLLLAAAALAGLRPEPLPISDADVTPERLALYEYFTANIGTTIQWEYLPRDAVPRPYTSEALLTMPDKPSPIPLEGKIAGATLLARNARQERWQIDVASEGARLIFYTLNFAGWQAWIDGRPAEVASWPGLGAVALSLPAGCHEVRLTFGDSPLRRLADWLSAAGVVIWLALGLAARPWRGLRRRHFWIAAGTIVAIAAAGGALHLWGQSPAPPALSDLTMDFIRQPYLHHNPGGVDFGAARLMGYTLSTDRAPAGETVQLGLDWAAEQAGLTAQVDLVLAVHEQLNDPPLLATSTVEVPTGGGTTRHDITVPTDAARGIYFLRVRVLGPQGPLTPRTTAGKALGHTFLRPLYVEAFRPAAGDEPMLGQFGPGVTLVEAQIEPAGDAHLAVALTWRCDSPLPANYALSLRAYDADGARVSRFDDTQPLRGLYPTAMWRPGELIADRHALPLAPGVAPDEAQTLEVVLYDRAAPDLAPLGVAYLPIQERPRSFQIPEMQTPLGTEFGGQMRLLGADLSQTVDALALTLHWQAIQPMTTDYKIFVHLFDPATEAIPVQDDAMPRRNSYPTRWWAAGEVVSDPIHLSLTGVPAGEYRLAVGVYDPATGDRLAAVDGQGSHNRLILPAAITVP
ncbi:MAG: 6-pyruvoyl-tetrahydropterin synthase-related protein [Chloroflexota bacterium]